MELLQNAWVVFTEYQADTPSIEGVFLSEPEADAYALELRRDAHADGENVYDYEPGEGEREATGDEADWTVTIGVQPTQLHQPAPAVATKRINHVDGDNLKRLRQQGHWVGLMNRPEPR